MDFGKNDIDAAIWNAVHRLPAIDIGLGLNPAHATIDADHAIDSLLTSPELCAVLGQVLSIQNSEEFRHYCLIRHDEACLAEMVWRELFLERIPIAEPCRMALTTLGMLGLNVGGGNLHDMRRQFRTMSADERLRRVISAANIQLSLYRYPVEPNLEPHAQPHGSFSRPMLDLTPIMADWPAWTKKVRRLGFSVKAKLDAFSRQELRRFLHMYCSRLSPVAFYISITPDSVHGFATGLLDAVMEIAREDALPLILTGHATHQENAISYLRHAVDQPRLRLAILSPAGCAESVAVAAHHCRNILVCGPDIGMPGSSATTAGFMTWFEVFGTAFHACPGPAHTPVEMAGRWAHLRWDMAKAMQRRFEAVTRTGWRVTEEDIESETAALLGGNLRKFLNIP